MFSINHDWLLLFPLVTLAAVCWWAGWQARLRQKKLFAEIRARGHWRVDVASGFSEWVPGTWETPVG
jgi:hypothetical protein